MKTLDPPRIHQLTRYEYEKMGEVGLFVGKHVELIEGRIIEMSPMGSSHATCVTLIGETLREGFGQDFVVRWQMPLDLGETSEPEPDVAVIPGRARDYALAHPKTAALIVEVAESSLDYDRVEKASLYAKAGIKDYWVVNLVDRWLEVSRDPVPDSSALYGFSYGSAAIHSESDSVSPLGAPQLSMVVRDLLP
jgi:Uma2 family endonuclease